MARILIIDDEPIIAMILQEVLSEEGHNVMTAPNGLAGLRMLRQDPLPDIVLVDLLMPRMSGKALIESMRSDARLRTIPVMIITGAVPCPEDFPPEGTYQALISKPFDLTGVIQKVQSLLETSSE